MALMQHGDAIARTSSSTTALSHGVSTRWLRSMTTRTSQCNGATSPKLLPMPDMTRAHTAMAVYGAERTHHSTTTSLHMYKTVLHASTVHDTTGTDMTKHSMRTLFRLSA